MVEKVDSDRSADILTHTLDEFVVLGFAVKEGRGKTVEFSCFGYNGGRFQSPVIA